MRTELDQLEAILNTPLPAPIDKNLRGNPRKFRSACIRSLIKHLGLSGISVTTPVYSMASQTDISVPYVKHGSDFGDYNHDCQTCEFCQHRWEARAHLERIILAAFPDLDNRSELQTDYFDSVLSIN